MRRDIGTCRLGRDRPRRQGLRPWYGPHLPCTSRGVAAGTAVRATQVACSAALGSFACAIGAPSQTLNPPRPCWGIARPSQLGAWRPPSVHTTQDSRPCPFLAVRGKRSWPRSSCQRFQRSEPYPFCRSSGLLCLWATAWGRRIEN